MWSRLAGKITGISFYFGLLGPKQLELLHEIVPKATAIGLLVNPSNPAADEQIKGAQNASLALGLQLYVTKARSESDFDPAFAFLVQQQVGALLIGGGCPARFFTCCMFDWSRLWWVMMVACSLLCAELSRQAA